MRLIAGAIALLCLTSCGSPLTSSRPASSMPGATATPTVTSTEPASTASAAASSTPIPATPTPTPTPATPPDRIQPGATAYVAVSVATGWRSPGVVRAIDAPALASPVRLRQWLSGMTIAQRADLIDRADTQLLLGERVEVLSLSGTWAQVVVPSQRTTLDSRGYPAWIPIGQLSAVPPPSAATVATVVVPTAWLRTAAGTAVLEVGLGTTLPVLNSTGTAVELGLPGNRALLADRSVLAFSVPGASPLPTDAPSVIATARGFLGLAYLWAGSSAFGFDCSGLVYTVYRAHGILLPRDADNQAMAGRPVSRLSLQPGDLVFFATNGYVHHVAIYLGSGRILDSPRTGAAVEVIPLSTYADYASARRVLP